MQVPPRLLSRVLCCAAAAVALAGCGGGGGGGSTPPAPAAGATATPIATATATATATASPTPVPTMTPFPVQVPQSATIVLPAPNLATAVPIPAPSGFAATIAVPANVPGTAGNALVTYASQTKPADLPALASGLSPLLYVELTPSQPLIVAAGTTFTVGLPGSIAGQLLTVSALDTQFLTWVDRAASCTVAGATATCTNASDLVLQHREYALAFSTAATVTPIVPPAVNRVNFSVAPGGANTTALTIPGAVSAALTFGLASQPAQIFGDATTNPQALSVPILAPSTGTPLFYFVLMPTQTTNIVPSQVNVGTLTIVYPPNTLPAGKAYALGGYDTGVPTSNYFAGVLTGKLTTDPNTGNQILSFDTTTAIGGANPTIPFQYGVLFGFVVYFS
jgi:hypothetical protein